ncbi:hypothetical protein T190607A02C_20058 [Tenacibaculum sp. 190524A02b]
MIIDDLKTQHTTILSVNSELKRTVSLKVYPNMYINNVKEIALKLVIFSSKEYLSCRII